MRRASLAALILGGTLAAACNGGGGGDDTATSGPSPTPTPDLSSALPADEAIDALAAIDPRFGSLFASATTGDTDALMELFDWQERPCGDPALDQSICLPETPPGTLVDSIAYGPVQGAAERELIDVYLRRLADNGLEPRLVLQSDTSEEVYFVYFTSDETVAGEPPFGGMPAFGGVELAVDLRVLEPVVRIDLLLDDWRPEYVVHPPSEEETILLYEP